MRRSRLVNKPYLEWHEGEATNEPDVVKITRDVRPEEIHALSDYDPDLERSGTVLAGDIGTIVDEYPHQHAFCVEFGVERNESLLVDCIEEDLELVEAYKSREA